jgi:hypothetical protein
MAARLGAEVILFVMSCVAAYAAGARVTDNNKTTTT